MKYYLVTWYNPKTGVYICEASNSLIKDIKVSNGYVPIMIREIDKIEFEEFQ